MVALVMVAGVNKVDSRLTSLRYREQFCFLVELSEFISDTTYSIILLPRSSRHFLVYRFCLGGSAEV